MIHTIRSSEFKLSSFDGAHGLLSLLSLQAKLRLSMTFFQMKLRIVFAVMACLMPLPLCAKLVVRVESRHVGFAGYVRPGSWTPLRITLENTNAEPMRVRCQWLLTDSDGDRVVSQRIATLSPRRKQHVWLYGMPTFNTTDTPQWKVKVVDDLSHRILAIIDVPLPKRVSPKDGMIAVMSKQNLGFMRFASNITQQEPIHFIYDISPANLPDRWYGFSALSALVWAPDSLEPSSPEISSQTIKALRQWVKRGGHLLIALPSHGQTWTHSPLVDILPPVTIRLRAGVDPLDIFGWSPVSNMSLKRPIDVSVFKLKADSPRAISKLWFLGRGEKAEPIVVAWQVGLGRVTLLGVDLSSRSLTRMRLPPDRYFWHAIFGWQSPAIVPQKANDMLDRNEIFPMHLRQKVILDEFITSLVAMRGTFTTPLLLAILVFFIYWLMAGPVGYLILRTRGLDRHLWLGFVAVVVVFTVFCWGSALLLKPTRTHIDHFSVMTHDSITGLTRTHSWLSVFVAKYGMVDLAINNGEASLDSSTIASPGLSEKQATGGFLDPQRYVITSDAPRQMLLPFRATAKQLEIDVLSRRVDALNQAEVLDQTNAQWELPHGELNKQDGFPYGLLTHRLPAALLDVLIVYCPGDRKPPLIWRHRLPWKPSEKLLISAATAKAGQMVPLVQEDKTDRTKWAGFIWTQMGHLSPTEEGDAPVLLKKFSEDQIRLRSELLSFYAIMPPPKWWINMVVSEEKAIHFRRTLARPLDLSAMLMLRGVLVMGYLDNVSLPASLRVDGEEIPSKGKVIVRCFLPIGQKEIPKPKLKIKPKSKPKV